MSSLNLRKDEDTAELTFSGDGDPRLGGGPGSSSPGGAPYPEPGTSVRTDSGGRSWGSPTLEASASVADQSRPSSLPSSSLSFAAPLPALPDLRNPPSHDDPRLRASQGKDEARPGGEPGARGGGVGAGAASSAATNTCGEGGAWKPEGSLGASETALAADAWEAAVDAPATGRPTPDGIAAPFPPMEGWTRLQCPSVGVERGDTPEEPPHGAPRPGSRANGSSGPRAPALSASRGAAPEDRTGSGPNPRSLRAGAAQRWSERRKDLARPAETGLKQAPTSSRLAPLRAPLVAWEGEGESAKGAADRRAAEVLESSVVAGPRIGSVSPTSAPPLPSSARSSLARAEVGGLAPSGGRLARIEAPPRAEPHLATPGDTARRLSVREGAPSARLWLGNIAPDATSETLATIMSAFGRLQEAVVFPTRAGPLGFAFVRFERVADALVAHEVLDGAPLPALSGKRPLKVRFKRGGSGGAHDVPVSGGAAPGWDSDGRVDDRVGPGAAAGPGAEAPWPPPPAAHVIEAPAAETANRERGEAVDRADAGAPLLPHAASHARSMAFAATGPPPTVPSLPPHPPAPGLLVPTRHLWLGNVTQRPPDALLAAVFAPFGTIESTRVFPLKSYAFVNFTNTASAIAAASALDGSVMPHLTGSKGLVVRYQCRSTSPVAAAAAAVVASRRSSHASPTQTALEGALAAIRQGRSLAATLDAGPPLAQLPLLQDYGPLLSSPSTAAAAVAAASLLPQVPYPHLSAMPAVGRVPAPPGRGDGAPYAGGHSSDALVGGALGGDGASSATMQARQLGVPPPLLRLSPPPIAQHPGTLSPEYPAETPDDLSREYSGPPPTGFPGTMPAGSVILLPPGTYAPSILEAAAARMQPLMDAQGYGYLAGAAPSRLLAPAGGGGGHPYGSDAGETAAYSATPASIYTDIAGLGASYGSSVPHARAYADDDHRRPRDDASHGQQRVRDRADHDQQRPRDRADHARSQAYRGHGQGRTRDYVDRTRAHAYGGPSQQEAREYIDAGPADGPTSSVHGGGAYPQQPGRQHDQPPPVPRIPLTWQGAEDPGTASQEARAPASEGTPRTRLRGRLLESLRYRELEQQARQREGADPSGPGARLPPPGDDDQIGTALRSLLDM